MVRAAKALWHSAVVVTDEAGAMQDPPVADKEKAEGDDVTTAPSTPSPTAVATTIGVVIVPIAVVVAVVPAAINVVVDSLQ